MCSRRLGLRDDLTELAVADLGGERVAAGEVGAAVAKPPVGDDLVQGAGGRGVSLVGPLLHRQPFVLEVLGGVLEEARVVDDGVDLVAAGPLAGDGLDVGQRHLVALGRLPDPPDHVIDVVGVAANERERGGIGGDGGVDPDHPEAGTVEHRLAGVRVPLVGQDPRRLAAGPDVQVVALPGEGRGRRRAAR